MRGAVLLAACLAAACGPGKFAIYSRPGGAEVYVDDVFLARTVNEATPVQLSAPFGTHSVRLTRPGYFDWVRDVEAISGKEVAVLADLQPLPAEPYHVPAGKFEIRTNPGGVRIFIDGGEIGKSKAEALRPVLVEDLGPGTYKIRVEREGYESDDSIFRIYANQTTRATFELVPLSPYFAFPTNDDVLRQAAIRAVRGVSQMSGMSYEKPIAIVQLEGANSGDAFRNLVEDVMIAELAHHGRLVAEREDHLLVRIANEAARGESLVLDVLTRHESADRPFLYDARLRSAAEALAVIKDDELPTMTVLFDENRGNSASVRSAEQILGYRIIEKSLRSDPSARPGNPEPMIRREAIVRLYCRLLDAKTGTVLWASRYEASVADEVPERVYRYLEKPPSRLYAYDQPDEESKSRDEFGLNAGEEEARVKKLRIGNQVESLFWYYRNLGEAYLRAGRFSEAVMTLKEAVNLRGDDYEARLFLGEALLKTGDLEAAGEEYKAALRSM